MRTPSEETVCGTVETVVYRNEENGYAVVELMGEDGREVTAVGTLPGISVGEHATLTGTWVNHPDYGTQLKVTEYERTLPTAETEILRYLAGGAIKGVGAVTAARIVAQFGADTFRVLESHPDWLSDIQGISAKKAKEIGESFRAQTAIRPLMVFCREFFGIKTTQKIYAKWGQDAVDRIKENPYCLCEEFDGIGFERADEIAAKLGLARQSAARVEAGLLYVLSKNLALNGHTCLPRGKLIEAAAMTLGVDRQSVETMLEHCISCGKIVSYDCGEDDCLLFDARVAGAEQYIADRLCRMDAEFPIPDRGDALALLDQAERDFGAAYAPLQRQAILSALRCGVLLITGGPGTGKTTIIRAILRIFDRLDMPVALAAPTGRAAKRMSEATQESAKTVHRLLEMDRGESERPVFNRNEKNPLDESVVIVDEASMLDLFLTEALLRAMKRRSRLILIGDADQLPSVGAGNILHDLLACERFTTIRLTDIFRQSEQSNIVVNAHRINEGEMPLFPAGASDFFLMRRSYEDEIVPTLCSLIQTRLPRAYGKDIVERIQVIAPSRRGSAGVDRINLSLQACLNPPSPEKQEVSYRSTVFREGDRVMQIRNDYELQWCKDGIDGCGAFNGDVGEIEEIDRVAETLTVLFEDGRSAVYDFDMLDELELAYAITVHKSQGSEYPVVIMPLYDCPPLLKTRNLLYTAITRARDMVILLGNPAVLPEMIGNTRQVLRYSALQDRLKEARK